MVKKQSRIAETAIKILQCKHRVLLTIKIAATLDTKFNYLYCVNKIQNLVARQAENYPADLTLN